MRRLTLFGNAAAVLTATGLLRRIRSRRHTLRRSRGLVYRSTVQLLSFSPPFAGNTNTMKRTTSKSRKDRQGIIAVLAAVLLIVMLTMIAFAVDIGYMGLAKTQLQAAADSAALAAAGSSNQTQSGMVQVAQGFAQYHQVGGRKVQLNPSDVQFGTWDVNNRTFSAVTGSGLSTAVKVTVHADTTSGGNVSLFFGGVTGVRSVAGSASAVAMVNPRDICFVVDLSSSMHNDTTPGSSSANSGLIQAVYDDLFGAGHVTYGSEPTKKFTGFTTSNDITYWMGQLGSTSGVLRYAIPAMDSSSATSKAYWTAYLNYVGTNGTVSYKTYEAYLMSCGRDQTIGSSQYSIMSVNNPSCHTHAESTDAGEFQFPVAEMPTHAVRRAIIAAIQIIKDRNLAINDANQKDWVSIVVFDAKNTGTDTTHVRVLKSLTVDYASVMTAATTMQACSDNDGSCTDSEGGLICAYNHIKGSSLGGQGRDNANKVVIFLTDGNANLYESSNSTINSYMNAHAGGWGSGYSQNGALMQSSIMQSGNWYLYALGVGGGCNQTFMNLMASKGGTAINGSTYAFATNANTYETTLKGIFNQIVTNPKLRLVQ
jgi:Flp pilus assembly protein TadG